MGKVARQVVEQAGIAVNVLIDKWCAPRVEHEAWFWEYLSEGPSGHFRRGAPGSSPYVSRFLTADFK